MPTGSYPCATPSLASNTLDWVLRRSLPGWLRMAWPTASGSKARRLLGPFAALGSLTIDYQQCLGHLAAFGSVTIDLQLCHGHLAGLL